MRGWRLGIVLAAAGWLLGCASGMNERGTGAVAPPDLRVATFNVSMYGEHAGEVLEHVRAGDARIGRIAAVIQRVRPDVILLNEFDWTPDPTLRQAFVELLKAPQPDGGDGIDYPHQYAAPVNTGYPSGLDLDGDGRADGPADAWGFGHYPGQYGMLLLSRYPIDAGNVRSFQHFRWADMPGALRPLLPDGTPFYPDATWTQLRLSSKSHWDVPIRTPRGILHLLAMHPTPPVFDGPENRNGRRNHDEIRLLAEYLNQAEWLVDDGGQRGGLADGAHFVIVGDLNADPHDGDGVPGAIAQLLDHPRIDARFVPESAGAAAAARSDGPPNDTQRGRPAADTANFAEPRSGNMRIDYVLPSRTLGVLDGGVFWPAPGQPGAGLADASDHHLVWLDLRVAP